MKTRRTKSFSLRIAFLIVCLMFIILIVNVNIEINSLKEEAVALEQQLVDADKEIQRLQIEFEKPITDDMMRQMARDMLGFYLPNEIIYEVS